MKNFIWAVALCFASMCSAAHADLILTGVTDGDLSGGNPKSIILTALCDVPDLSIFGVGSANNGGGTNGEEFALAGSASAGDLIVIAGNADSSTFFGQFDNILLFENGAANINGDDAIELFENDLVVDTYGVIDVDGTDQTWEYADGYSARVSGSAGAFVEADWDFNNGELDGLDATAQANVLAGAFGFTTAAVPEPASASLIGLVALALCGLRRRS